MGERHLDWPFSIPPGKKISSILKNTENVIRELGDDWIVKTPSFRTRLAGRNTLDYLKEMQDDYRLLQKYIPDFIVETHFVWGEEKERQKYFVIQGRLKGKVRSLHQVSDEELAKPEIASQLKKFVEGVLRMYEETGKTPDLWGRPNFSLRFYNPRHADNILLVEDESGRQRLMFTDIGELSSQSRSRNPHTRFGRKLILKNLKAFRERLNSYLE